MVSLLDEDFSHLTPDVLPLFDAHCDTISALEAADGGTLLKNNLHVDLTRAGQYAAYAQCFALWGDPDRIAEQGGAAVLQALYDRFRQEMDRCADQIIFCRTRQDFQTARTAGKMAAFLSVEGADLLDCSIDALRRVHSLGVRIVNLTWNRANILSGSHMDQPDRGLSEEGEEFVRAMLRLRMLPDVSHLSEPGFWDVADLCLAQRRPFVATHSNAKALCPHSRNLTDDQFRAIIRSGGVVGLNLYTDFLGQGATLDTALDHVLHFIELGGQKHICLGCDLDGCDTLPPPIRGVEDLHLLAEGLHRLNRKQNHLAKGLLARNLEYSMIEDLFYNNLERVILCSM